MPETNEIIGGADTHADTIHVAVISTDGRPVADHEFATTMAGYRAAIKFLNSQGVPRVVGVEETSSYGAGFTRALVAEGISVAEVYRPDKATRRRTCWMPIRPLGPHCPVMGYPSRKTSGSVSCGPCSAPVVQQSRRAPPRSIR
ncbi:IS110 family transposase [Nocardia sp. CA2R105]|nr:IS110 family transposase [Nocardia coffeae]